MWRPARRLRAPCPEPMVISDTVAKRRGARCALHKRLQRAALWPALAPRVQPRRELQVAARSGNRSDGRPSSGLFWENTNLEWTALATRKRTPAVESIFRGGVRVRSERAASAVRAVRRVTGAPRRRDPLTRRAIGPVTRAALAAAALRGAGHGGVIGAMTARAHYNERLSGRERRAAAGASVDVSDAGSAVRRPPYSIAHIVPRYKPGIDPARAL
ncbi:hypothetical protein RR48_14230 [Papilio machaon]|uniref:Uncharacterized protein n=1 Tax=Papilio machaon TaxID=76193 RepID=A0A194QSH2_PAPMA|nr:hypothetical protein RR48_14230 [Papilio machaon]